MSKRMMMVVALAACMGGALGVQAQMAPTGAAAHVEPAKSFDASLTDFEKELSDRVAGVIDRSAGLLTLLMD